jgi:hypothetical protein
VAVFIGEGDTFCWVVYCLLLLLEYIFMHFYTLNYEVGHYWDFFLAAVVLSLALFNCSTHTRLQGFEFYVLLQY